MQRVAMEQVLFIVLPSAPFSIMCWDTPVCIATRYGLDGPGIESPWGARFSAPVQTGSGAHPASCTTGTGSFPRVKRPRRGFDLPPRLKKEYSGASATSLGLHGLLLGLSTDGAPSCSCTLALTRRTNHWKFGTFRKALHCIENHLHLASEGCRRS
jgi:hypothetical protein